MSKEGSLHTSPELQSRANATGGWLDMVVVCAVAFLLTKATSVLNAAACQEMYVNMPQHSAANLSLMHIPVLVVIVTARPACAMKDQA